MHAQGRWLITSIPISFALFASACGGGGGAGAADPPSYTIGGSVAGLVGTVILQNNGADTASITKNGSFTFQSAVVGGNYAVTVKQQPATQTCVVSNGSGKANANYTGVVVTCTTTSFTIGGSVSGLVGTIILQNNGADTASITQNGSFTFPSAVAGGSYSVTVAQQPATQTCVVSNGAGVASADYSGVLVACTTNTYTVSGTVTGLQRAIVLQNNGGDSLQIGANGAFMFPAAVDSGTVFAVSVASQALAQACTVTDGSGTGLTNITNVGITCVARISFRLSQVRASMYRVGKPVYC